MCAAQVDEAIAKRLCALQEETGAVAERARQEVEEDAFWQEEIERRIRESNDARLALQLIRQQREAGGAAGDAAGERGGTEETATAAAAPGADAGHREVLEVARVEAEFERAMRQRAEESDAALARRLEREEGARRSRPRPPSSPKLKLAQRLIRRFQRRADDGRRGGGGGAGSGK